MLCPKCGKQMLERQEDSYCLKDDILIDKKTGREKTGVSALELLASDLQSRVVKYFYCLYVDGYADIESSEAVVYIFDEFVRVSTYFGHEFLAHGRLPFHLDLPYKSIQLLNVSLEREITALRTWLIGPVLGALFKKETLMLNIGFIDERGLLQIPSFKMEKNEVHDCYRLIHERMAKAKKC